jgi:hypothetical protein
MKRFACTNVRLRCIDLTREVDYLRAPAPEERPAALQVDGQGRMQTYPAIALAGAVPFAVIQSTGDSYVPADEARQLFGPDSSARRQQCRRFRQRVAGTEPDPEPHVVQIAGVAETIATSERDPVR